MDGDQVTLRYCNHVGDVITTTLAQARAGLVVEGLPVRLPPTYRGQRSYPGLFWAATNQRTLVYESLLELDRLWLADHDPTVTAMATQPFQLSGRDGPAVRSHVPDVLLVHAGGAATVVDVKPSAFVAKPAVRAQLEWTRALCRTKGWRYEVFTGADPTVLRNIKTLAVGRRPERLPDGHLAHARAALGATVGKAPTPLGEVLAGRPATCDDASWRVAVLACLWAGHATADLTRPLTAQTFLTAAREAAA
ncbi:TnsA-like heteromeric transposase endonuclease subunit [uncultured Pseudokineococcus sp.]|uniref:TnsA-like heteromeric transposase endonuclease subunit n=1 Tax=uncultured Pseudokineococcus sp. TaxID=1642928 RepID=UPI002633CF34|nr:TnsA-like heteromeric transposase endonuclease subunit [uncultured Pseudokineococcus sp.]